MKQAAAVLLMLVLSMCTYSQSTQGGSKFDAAVEAFESGEYEKTISLLEAHEKSFGTSPRLESLRALAYRDLEKPKEAHQAILVYLRLTANRDMSGSEAHQDMLKLRDEMLEAIEKKYKDDKEKLDKEREEEAKEAVEQLEAIYRSPEIRISSSTSVPASIKKAIENDSPGEYIGPPESAPKPAAPGMDALAELEMWRKISQSTVAIDYFLFIESFPSGQFADIAREKMFQIGDPAWNAVRDTHDPFKVRDFVKSNPDSPFLELAKSKMKTLAEAAIEWETLKDSKDQYMLKAFEVRNPGHPLAAEAKKLRGEIVWNGVSGSRSIARLEEFIGEFPESPRVMEARAAIDGVRPKPTIIGAPPKEESDPAALFRMAAVHHHGGVQLGIGDVSFDGARLVFREREQVGMGTPDATHTFSIACSELKEVKYKHHTLTLATRSGVEKQLIPTTESDGSQDKIKEKLEILEKRCGLKK